MHDWSHYFTLMMKDLETAEGELRLVHTPGHLPDAYKALSKAQYQLSQVKQWIRDQSEVTH